VITDTLLFMKYRKDKLTLVLMPGRIYRVVDGILIKRSINPNGFYCNTCVYTAGNYFRSDNKEYLAITKVSVDEIFTHDIPNIESEKHLLKSEELLEIVSSPQRENSKSLGSCRVTMFYQWWDKWVGGDPCDLLSHEQIGICWD
jgi:hypothetical protein